MSFKPSKALKVIFAFAILLGLLVVSLLSSLTQSALGQFPTVSIPTVTSSPRGLYIKAVGGEYDTLNVRSYPSSTSTQIGVFLVGQEAKAYGYYNDYVLIDYPGAPGGKGWVWIQMVQVFGGTLPPLEPPPTPSPLVTKTIDPTLAAQFIITVQPTRLPTFTEPPPLQIPTFQSPTGATATGGIPMGYVIIILAGLGIFLTLIAVLRRG